MDMSEAAVYLLTTGVPIAAGHFAIVGISHACSDAYRKLDEKTRMLEWGLEIMSMFVCTALFFGYVTVCWEFAWDPVTRWQGDMEIGRYTVAAHINLSIYESIIYIAYGKPKIFLAHHLIVLANYVPVLLTGHFQFWAAWDGLVEITNLPLCLMTYMRRIPEYKASTFFLLNGACIVCSSMRCRPLFSNLRFVCCAGVNLWVLFVIFRVLSMPLWMCVFSHDCIYTNMYTETLGFNGILRNLVAPSTVAIWVLSMTWFVKIHAGMMKALKNLKLEKNPEKKA
jgi:hypothetical protein